MSLTETPSGKIPHRLPLPPATSAHAHTHTHTRRDHLEEALELWRDVIGELDRILDDVMDERVDRVGVERGLADVELVQNHTQGPQVDLEKVWRV